MGDPKVLNEHYPPELPQLRRRRKSRQIKVRIMLPMSVRCNTCGNYMYKGTNFNSRKEVVLGETHLGNIQIFRFYFKCTKCSAELTIKTDPQNKGYVVESGATRSFEPWPAKDENRALGSEREIDVVAAIDETRSIKSTNATVTVDEIREAFQSVYISVIKNRLREKTSDARSSGLVSIREGYGSDDGDGDDGEDEATIISKPREAVEHPCGMG